MSELWLGTWWDVFGGARPLYSIAPPTAKALCWPLYRERRYPLRRLALAGTRYCRHSLPEGESIPALASSLARRHDWDELHFTGVPLPQAQRWREGLTAAGSLHARISPPRQQRYVALDRPWREVEADFHPRLLRNLQRRERGLEQLGRLQLRVHTNTTGLEELFEACANIEASGWKGREGTAMRCHRQRYRFYRLLAVRAAAVGALRLGLLFFNDTVIAFSLGIVQGEALASLKTGHLESWRRYAPGAVLTHRLLFQAHAHNLREFDLGGGDDAYKAAWTPHARTLASVQAFNRTGRGAAAALLAGFRQALRPRGRAA